MEKQEQQYRQFGMNDYQINEIYAYDKICKQKGTSDRRCNCHSWKQHWINFSGKEWPAKCMALGCDRKVRLGAHITKQGERREYIIPACEGCNQSSSAFYLKQGACLVSANQSETCGKNDER